MFIQPQALSPSQLDGSDLLPSNRSLGSQRFP